MPLPSAEDIFIVVYLKEWLKYVFPILLGYMATIVYYLQRYCFIGMCELHINF